MRKSTTWEVEEVIGTLTYIPLLGSVIYGSLLSGVACSLIITLIVLRRTRRGE